MKSGQQIGKLRKIGTVDNLLETLYWHDVEKISNLQRLVAIHCILYYHLNKSIISDADYDRIARSLFDMQSKANETDFAKTTYYYAFKNFHPASGFYLLNRFTIADRNYLTMIANHVLYLKGKEENE